MDSANQFSVCKLSDQFIVIAGKLATYYEPARGYVLTNDQAVGLGIWLLSVADPEGEESRRLLEEVRKS